VLGSIKETSSKSNKRCRKGVRKSEVNSLACIVKYVKCGEVWKDLFHKLPKHFKNGSVTTNGIKAMWHVKHPEKEKLVPKYKKKLKRTVSAKKSSVEKLEVGPELPNKHYGTHSKDVFFASSNPFNVIAIDPGHATVIDAVYHEPHEESNPPSPVFSTKRTRKENKAFKLLNRANRVTETFRLTNKTWCENNGRNTHNRNIARLQNHLNMQVEIDML
jgi:hypothetical protein